MQSLPSNNIITTNQLSMITGSIVAGTSVNSIRILTADSSLYLSHSSDQSQNKPLHKYSITKASTEKDAELNRIICSNKSYNKKITEIEALIHHDWHFPKNLTYSDILNKIREDFKEDNPRMNCRVYRNYFRFQCVKFINDNDNFKEQLLCKLDNDSKFNKDSHLFKKKRYIIGQINALFSVKNARKKQKNKKLKNNILTFTSESKNQSLHDARGELFTNDLRHNKADSKKEKKLMCQEEWQFSDNPSFEDIQKIMTEDFFEENSKIENDEFSDKASLLDSTYVAMSPISNESKNLSEEFIPLASELLGVQDCGINEHLTEGDLCGTSSLENDKTQKEETTVSTKYFIHQERCIRKIQKIERQIPDKWKFSSELTYQDMKNKITEEFTQNHERISCKKYRNYFKYNFLYFLDNNCTLQDKLLALLPKRQDPKLNSELGQHKKEIIADIKQAISAKKRYIKKRKSTKPLARNNHFLSSTSLSLSKKENKILKQNNVDSSESNNLLVNISKAKEEYIHKKFEQEAASQDKLENFEEFQADSMYLPDFLNEDVNQSNIECIPGDLQTHELRSMDMEYCSESINAIDIDFNLFGDVLLKDTLFLNEDK